MPSCLNNWIPWKKHLQADLKSRIYKKNPCSGGTTSLLHGSSSWVTWSLWNGILVLFRIICITYIAFNMTSKRTRHLGHFPYHMLQIPSEDMVGIYASVREHLHSLKSHHLWFDYMFIIEYALRIHCFVSEMAKIFFWECVSRSCMSEKRARLFLFHHGE